MLSNHIKVVSIVVECAPIIFWFYTWKVTCVPFFLFFNLHFYKLFFYVYTLARTWSSSRKAVWPVSLPEKVSLREKKLL